ncbi:MAG: adenylate/guanylate cyclase domain-containing protein [Verrucomicrobiota bacterium]
MKRYILTALGIGALVALAVITLYFLRAFENPTDWLSKLWASRGMFRGNGIQRAIWLEVTVILIASMGVAWALIDITQFSQKLLVLIASALVIFGISPTLALYGYLFEPFSSLTAVLLSGISALIFAGTERGMRKRVLERVLGTRVSRKTFNALMDSPSPPEFGGATREVTVLTCRILNHDSLREQVPAADLLKMSNLFIRSTSSFLVSKGAYLDESGPDQVRVFFGVLKDSSNHAEVASRVALELRGRLEILAQECQTRFFHQLDCGTGLCSGQVNVGVYGANHQYHFSAVGNVIESSRRLAITNSRYRSGILMSAATYQQVKDMITVRPMEMFYEPQTEVMSEIYQPTTLTADQSAEQQNRDESFWHAIVHYRARDFHKAIEQLHRAEHPGREDGPIQFFLDKCQSALDNPAGTYIDGQHEMVNNNHTQPIDLM